MDTSCHVRVVDEAGVDRDVHIVRSVRPFNSLVEHHTECLEIIMHNKPPCRAQHR